MQWTYKGKQQMSSKLSGGESFIVSFYIQLIMGSFADMQQSNSIRFVILTNDKKNLYILQYLKI